MLYNINVPNCDVEGICCSSDHCTVIDDYCNKIIVALQSSTEDLSAKNAQVDMCAFA